MKKRTKPLPLNVEIIEVPVQKQRVPGSVPARYAALLQPRTDDHRTSVQVGTERVSRLHTPAGLSGISFADPKHQPLCCDQHPANPLDLDKPLGPAPCENPEGIEEGHFVFLKPNARAILEHDQRFVWKEKMAAMINRGISGEVKLIDAEACCVRFGDGTFWMPICCVDPCEHANGGFAREDGSRCAGLAEGMLVVLRHDSKSVVSSSPYHWDPTLDPAVAAQTPGTVTTFFRTIRPTCRVQFGGPTMGGHAAVAFAMLAAAATGGGADPRVDLAGVTFGRGAEPAEGESNSVRYSLQRGVYLSAGPHADLVVNATLSSDDFAAGQEIRVRLTASWTDLTLRFFNESVYASVSVENTTLVCFNGTLEAQDATEDDVRAWVGANRPELKTRDVFLAGGGRWGACAQPVQNVTAEGAFEERAGWRSGLADDAAAGGRFNASDGAGMQFVVWPAAGGGPPRCGAVGNATAFYYYTDHFGAGNSTSGFAGGVQTEVFVTFQAPDFPFYMCFRRALLDDRLSMNASSRGWIPVRTDSDGFIHTPVSNRTVLYHLPPDLTAGQFVALKIVNRAYGWDFGSVSLSPPSPPAFADGDNLKLVPTGAPCTFESHVHPYYGTQFVDASGAWVERGYPGMSHGATVGGVGVFGSETGHPGVDGGESVVKVYAEGNRTVQSVVVFVQLPEREGAYDVCLSLREDRAALKWREKDGLPAPLWRKIKRCPVVNGTNPQCATADGSAGAEPPDDPVHLWAAGGKVVLAERAPASIGSTDFDTTGGAWQYPSFASYSFTVSPEDYGWAAADLTPESHAWIRIDTGATRDVLHPFRATEYQAHDRKDYYHTAAGDQARLVSEVHFAPDSVAQGYYYPDSTSTTDIPFEPQWDRPPYTRVAQFFAGEAPFGTPPAAGCWQSSDDAYAEFGSPHPTATIHLAGDPTEWDWKRWRDSGGAPQFSPNGTAAAKTAGEGEDNGVRVVVEASVWEGSVELELSGPADVWYGCLFGAEAAIGNGYAIVVHSAEQGFAVSEVYLRDYTVTRELHPSPFVRVWDRMWPGVRSVRLRRGLAGLTGEHFSFGILSNASSIAVLPAAGTAEAPSFSGVWEAQNRAAVSLPLGTAVFPPNSAADAFAALAVPQSGRWRVCYRKRGVHGWRQLVHRRTGGAKWAAPGAAGYPFDRDLVPGFWFGAAGPTNESRAWRLECNDTRAGTAAELTVGGAPVFADTLRNNYHRGYAPSDRVADSVGFALRLVPETSPCHGIHAANLQPRQWSESLDAGLPSCTLEQLLYDGYRDCSGPLLETSGPVGEVTFEVTLPEEGAYRVCLRYGGMNWGEVEGGVLQVGGRPRMRVAYNDAFAAGRQGVGVVEDEDEGLRTRADAFGDWARLVESGKGCAPVASAEAGSIAGAALRDHTLFTGAATALYAQRWCGEQPFREPGEVPPGDGAGNATGLASNATTQFEPCFGDAVLAASFCAGDCSTAFGRHALSRAVARGNFPYNYLLPPLSSPGPDAFRFSAVMFELPAEPAAPLQLCYKQSGKNWVALPLRQDGSPAPPARVSLAAGTAGRTLLAGAVEEIGVDAPAGTSASFASAKLVATERLEGQGLGDRALARDALAAESTRAGVVAVSVMAVGGRVVIARVWVEDGGVVGELTGPEDSWFSVGFGAAGMAGSYAVVVALPADGATAGAAALEERCLETGSPGQLLAPTIVATSQHTANSYRTVRFTRPAQGGTPAHYSFPTGAGAVPVIAAFGAAPGVSYHGEAKATGVLAFDFQKVLPRTYSFSPAPSLATVELRLAEDSNEVVVDAAFPDGTWLAAAFFDPNERLAPPVEPEGLGLILGPAPGAVTAALFAPTGAVHAAAGGAAPAAVSVAAAAAANGTARVVLSVPFESVAGALRYAFARGPGSRIGVLLLGGTGDPPSEGGGGGGDVTLNASGTLAPAYQAPVRGGFARERLCGRPPASTQASPFAAASDRPVVQRGGGAVFAVVAPHEPGEYAVCVALNDSAGWARAGSVRVADNEVRWGTGDELINQAVVDFDLTRPSYFNLAPGGDAVKLIPALHRVGSREFDTACFEHPAGLNYDTFGGTRGFDPPEGVEQSEEAPGGFGDGVHVGLDVDPQASLTDLGPGDGAGKTAFFRTTLPGAGGGRYKLCVLASAAGTSGAPRRWFEARSGGGGGRRLRLDATPAGVAAAVLHPRHLVGSRPELLASFSSVVVPSGALLEGVPGEPSPGTPSVRFAASPGVSDAVFQDDLRFKFVEARQWVGSSWASSARVTCEDASSFEGELSCTSYSDAGGLTGTCAVPLFGAVNADARSYLWCVRPGNATQWRQLLVRSGAGAASKELVAAPSGWSFSAAHDEILVFASAANNQTGGLYWCSETSPSSCVDALAVTPASQPCPLPTSTADWRSLAAKDTRTASVALSAFPALPAEARVCLKKSEDTAAARAAVAYQLWNSGPEATGGRTAYYNPLAADALRVASDGAAWDPEEELFICPASGACAVPVNARMLPSGFLTRSRVVGGREVLSLTVRAVAGGRDVPVSRAVVWIEWCTGLADAECAASSTERSFSVANARGTCSAGDSAHWGWPAGGTTQVMTDGVVSYELVFSSACPPSTLHLGCGFRFVAAVPSGDAAVPDAVLRSPPVWVNVEALSPNAVEVFSLVVDGAGRDVSCPAFRLCALVLKPARNGEPLRAATGRYSVTVAYNASEVVGFTSLASGSWDTAAAIDLSTTATLLPGVSGSWVLITANLATVAIPLRVRVYRPPIEAVKLLGLHPLHLEGLPPQPSWRAHQTDRPASTLHAASGSYMAVLHPYELHVVAEDAFGYLPEEGLLGVEVGVQLFGGDGARLPIFGVPAGGSFTAEALQSTSEAYFEETRGENVSNVTTVALAAGVQAGVAGLAVRVRSPAGCSRFAEGNAVAAGSGATGMQTQEGCTIVVSVGNATASLASPLRGLADALRVTLLPPVPRNGTESTPTPTRTATLTLDGSPDAEPAYLSVRMLDGLLQPPPDANLTSVPMDPGVRFWIQPVSLHGAFVDEFHYGSAVAFFDETPLFASTDGYTGPAGASLARNEWEFGYHPGRGWGAEGVLELDRGCAACAFTFHSTFGAGGGLAESRGGRWELAKGVGRVDGIRVFDASAGMRCGNVEGLRLAAAGEETGDEPAGETLAFSLRFDVVDVAGQRVLRHAPASVVLRVQTLLLFSNGTVSSSVLQPSGNSSALVTPFTAGVAVVSNLRLLNALPNETYQLPASALQDPDQLASNLASPWPSVSVLISTLPALLADAVPYIDLSLVLHGSVFRSVPENPWEVQDVMLERSIRWDASESDTLELRVAVFESPGVGGAASEAPRNFTASAGGAQLGATAQLLPHNTSASDWTAMGHGGVSLNVTWARVRAGEAGLALRLAAAAVCRDCRLLVCSVGAGAEPSTDLVHPCFSVRLYIVATRADRGVELVRSQAILDPTTHLGATPAGPSVLMVPCTSVLQLFALAFVSVRGVKTIAYDDPAAAFEALRNGTAKAVSPGSSSASGGVFAAAADRAVAPVLLQFTEPTPQPAVSYEIRAASDASESAPPGGYAVAVTGAYTWGFPDAVPAGIQVLDVGEAEFGCGGSGSADVLPKAAGAGYYTLSPRGGAGMALADGGGYGPVAHVPFLVSVQVVTRGGGVHRGYPPTAVRVALHSALACGAGGALRVLAPGSFAALDAPGVVTARGQANFWLNFSEPCQTCRLAFQLCYSRNASTREACMAATEDPPDRTSREVISKPFSVAPYTAHGSVVVDAVHLPEPADVSGRVDVAAGDAVAIDFSAAAAFGGGWLLPAAGTARVVLAVAESGSGVADRRYAYGGFLGAAAGRAGASPCSAVDADAATGTGSKKWGLVKEWEHHSRESSERLAFYFTRPCARCTVSVAAEFRPSPAGAFGAARVYSLRSSAAAAGLSGLGAVLSFTVRSCAVAWAVVPPRIPLFFARRPFVIPLWPVDAFGFPAGEPPPGTTALLQQQQQQMQQEQQQQQLPQQQQQQQQRKLQQQQQHQQQLPQQQQLQQQQQQQLPQQQLQQLQQQLPEQQQQLPQQQLPQQQLPQQQLPHQQQQQQQPQQQLHQEQEQHAVLRAGKSITSHSILGTVDEPLVAQHVDPAQPLGLGNGGGGLLRLTNAQAGSHAPLVGGTALPRFTASRACFSCAVALLNGSFNFAVDGGSLAAFSAAPSTGFADQPAPGTPGSGLPLNSSFFAADSAGDRVYGVGGPAWLALRRPYLPVRDPPACVFALGVAGAGEVEVQGQNGFAVAPVLSGGAAVESSGSLRVANGVVVGVQGGGSPPSADLSLAVTGGPASDAALSVALLGGNLPVPVVFSATGEAAVVTAAPSPTSLAVVTPPLRAGGHAVKLHEWLTIEVWAVGRGASAEDAAWYLSAFGGGRVWVESCGAAFAGDGFSEREGVEMVRGKAVLRVQFYEGRGACRLRVAHAAYRDGRLDVAVAEPAADRFSWRNGTAGIFVLSGGGRPAYAFATPGTPTSISFAAVDGDGAVDLYYSAVSLGRAVFTTRPAGCFEVAAEPVLVAAGVVTVSGTFSAGPACAILSLENGPGGADFDAPLAVRLQAPAAAVVLRHGGTRANFTNTAAVAGLPAPAARTDTVFDLVVAIVDEHGVLARGLSGPVVAVEPRGEGGEGEGELPWRPKSAQAAVVRGTAVFSWAADRPTRWGEAGEGGGRVLPEDAGAAAGRLATASMSGAAACLAESVALPVVCCTHFASETAGNCPRLLTPPQGCAPLPFAAATALCVSAGAGLCTATDLHAGCLTGAAANCSTPGAWLSDACALDDDVTEREPAAKHRGVVFDVQVYPHAGLPGYELTGVGPILVVVAAVRLRVAFRWEGSTDPWRVLADGAVVRGLVGRLFALRVEAVDASLNLAAAPEDAGSAAVVAFSPAAVPCRAADAAAPAAVACGPPGNCTWWWPAPPPPCGSGRWVAPPWGFSVQLAGGRGVLAGIKLGGLAGGAPPQAPERVRVTAASRELAGVAVAFSLVELSGLRVRGAACNGTRVAVCTLPEASGVGVGDGVTVSDGKAVHTVSLHVDLVVTGGAVQTVAESGLDIVGVAVCLDAGSSPTAPRWGLFHSRALPLYRPAGWNVRGGGAGGAGFESTAFFEPCERAVLSFTCRPSRSIGAGGAVCDGVTLTTAEFSVRAAAAPPPAPPAGGGGGAAGGWPVLTVATGVVAFGFADLFDRLPAAEIASELAAALAERETCRVVDSEDAFIERPACDRVIGEDNVLNPDCECRAVGLSNATIAVLRICLVTEREAIAGSLADYRMDPAKCRASADPSTAAPSAHTFAALSTEVLFPIVDFELRSGTRHDPGSAAAQVSLAAEALRDHQDPAYLKLRLYYAEQKLGSALLDVALPEGTPEERLPTSTVTLPDLVEIEGVSGRSAMLLPLCLVLVVVAVCAL
ncbi:hypothetical protein DIPPA_24251 [Diplonema papillatum]|nr:hypothetical protein DIPPA_24251 [Diplonema papillatum]